MRNHQDHRRPIEIILRFMLLFVVLCAISGCYPAPVVTPSPMATMAGTIAASTPTLTPTPTPLSTLASTPTCTPWPTPVIPPKPTPDIPPEYLLPNDKAAFGLSDMVAGDLRYGDSVAHVEALLGNPKQTSDGSDDLRSLDYIVYEYESGDAYVFMKNWDEKDYFLQSAYLSSSLCEGPRGIRIGDPPEKVLSSFKIAPLDPLPADRVAIDIYEPDGPYLYATAYTGQEDDSFSNSVEGRLFATYDEPSGFIECRPPFGRDSGDPQVFFIRYAFPLYPYDQETIDGRNTMYSTSGILTFSIAHGAVTEISWTTYAAE